MTWWTSRSNGAMPPRGSERPNTLPRRTSQAGQVGQGAAALVGVLDALAASDARGRRQRLVDSPAGLDRGLLVGRDHQVARVQQLAVPAARIQIKDAAGLDGEVRGDRKDPRPVLPRPDRVGGQPAQDRRLRGITDPALDNEPMNVSRRASRQRHAVAGRLARDRLDLGDLLRGKSGTAGPTALDPGDLQGVVRRTVVATDQRSSCSYPAAPRSPRSTGPERRTRPAERAGHPETAPSATPRPAQAPRALRR